MSTAIEDFYKRLVQRAIQAARNTTPRERPLRAEVRDIFHVGSTTATDLCRAADDDPERILKPHPTLARCAEVIDVLENARLNHKPINSAHEGYSVILEEVEEFWEEVRKRRSERDPEAMLLELTQIAAVAIRTAQDVVMPLIEAKKGGAA